MRRIGPVLLAFLLLSACASERSDDAKQPGDAKQADDTKQPASEDPVAPSDPEPPTFEGTRVSAGPPGLVFSLELGESGMSGGQAGSGDILTLSGPPGGPLMLIISPATVGADFSGLVGGDQPLDATLVEQRVELLGAERRAVAWITGESLARTSWCGIIVAPEGAGEGDAALLLELGVGYSGDDTTCASAREHHLLGPVVESLRFEP